MIEKDLIALDRLCLEISDMTLIKEIRYYETVDSTNKKARELLLNDELKSDALVLAEIQTAGKGRRGRNWSSPAGGLWFSLVLKCPIETERLALISLLSALAVAQALDKHVLSPPVLKWPNDVQACGKKIAGILVELVEHSEMGRFFIIGVGINVNNKVELTPEIQDIAISLQECGGSEHRLESVLIDVLRSFESNYKCFINHQDAEIISLFKQRCSHLGQQIRIQQENGEMIALCLDISIDGSLLVEDASGQKHRLVSGDLTII